MDGMVNQFLFKSSLLSFLGVLFWGMLNDISFQSTLLRSSLTALGVYFTIIIYLSAIRLIMKSGGNVREKVEENQT